MVMTEPKQLWIVTDDDNDWLWTGRGSQDDAVKGAQASPFCNSDTTLLLYAIQTTIVLEPIKV